MNISINDTIQVIENEWIKENDISYLHIQLSDGRLITASVALK